MCFAHSMHSAKSAPLQASDFAFIISCHLSVPCFFRIMLVCASTFQRNAHYIILTLYLCLIGFIVQSSNLTKPSFCNLPSTIPGSLLITSAKPIISFNPNFLLATKSLYSSLGIKLSSANKSAASSYSPDSFSNDIP